MSDVETNDIEPIDIEPTFDTLIESIKKFATYIKTLEKNMGDEFGMFHDITEDFGRKIKRLEEKVFGEVQSSTVTSRRNRSTRRNRRSTRRNRSRKH